MTTHTPLRCAYSGMVAQSGKIVLLNSGNYPSFSSYGNETWIWNGTNGNEDWTNVSPAFINTSGPIGPSVPAGAILSARINQAMALDTDGYVVVYGGQSSSSLAGIYQDTWTFNGTTWTLQSPATVPYGRMKAEAAYLASDGYTVMFGGQTLYNLLDETWVWNGTTWAQMVFANGVGPAGRVGHCMAASPTEVVLFGGNGTANNLFGDTWTFNGTTWTQPTLTGGVSPSFRTGACIAYDSTNALFVLFGGQNDSAFINDTWTFNPSTNTWAQITVANGAGPAGRIGAQMAFDTTNHLTIMYGGISAGDLYPSNATWSFNGATLTWAKL